MPEGPEIRYLTELARKKLVGKYFENIISNSKTKITIPSREKIINVGSKGKILWLETKKYYFHIHFGLTGWLLFGKSKYPKYILQFSNGIEAKIDDIRRFSKLKVIKTKEKHLKRLNKLGIDILTDSFTFEQFNNIIKSKKSIIAALLLDQHIFAGIGNYIKKESLYRAKISPKRKCNNINDNEMYHLYNDIRYVAFCSLIEELRDGHLKIPNDIRKISPKVPKYYKFSVYERNKDNKGNKITIENIAGRRSFYVKSIQK